MTFPTWDVFERRGCDCYIRARTMDDYLLLLFVVSEPTLHVSHWPHHTESIILQQTLIDIPSWLLRWLTRFVLTTAYNCYIQNVHYETLSVKTMYIKYLSIIHKPNLKLALEKEKNKSICTSHFGWIMDCFHCRIKAKHRRIFL